MEILNKTQQSSIEELKTKLQTSISLENELTQLIEVTKPYYAFQGIAEDNNTLRGIVCKEFEGTYELDGMSYSEAGRHLAILGSLAIAKTNPIKKKHYYLANKANVKRVYRTPYSDVLHIGEMSTKSFNKRNAVAEGCIKTADGKVIYEIEVEYSVLTEVLFNRMFSQHKQNTDSKPNYNPYRNSIHFKDTVKTDTICSASLGKVESNDCVGHFDNYPALPVARIAQALINIASVHMNFCAQETKPISITHVLLEAKSFAFAGETMHLKSCYDHSVKKENQMAFIETYAYINDNHTKHAAYLSCRIE